jgi:DNA processing protein
LSQGILVVEGDLKSGSLITARLGLEEGRSIFAVPGSIFSAGSQGPIHLLKQGAILVSCGEDIVKELNWGASSPTMKKRQIPLLTEQAEVCPIAPVPLEIPSTVSDEERALLQGIPMEAIAIEDLQQTSGLPSAKINQCLTMLELEGLIVLLPGAKVCRK